MERQIRTDVLIIGGGVTGAAIARELSRYNVNTMLIEREPDLSMGISKTGHGIIYTGSVMAYSMILKSIMAPDAPLYEPESVHQQVVEEGFLEFDDLLHHLDVAHKHQGALTVATNAEELKTLKMMEALTKKIHLLDSDVRIIDRDAVFEIEPYVTREATAALYDRVCAISIFPPELVFALAENAMDNGVHIMPRTEARRISTNNGMQTVETNNGMIHTRFIVNAAGKYVDDVADMAGARDDWGLMFNRSQMVLLDKRLSGLVNHIVSPVPAPGKAGMVAPLLEGNPYVVFGSFKPTTDREDRATTMEDFRTLFAGAKSLVPSLSERDVITSFVGIRTFNTRNPEEHILEASKVNPKLINVAVKMPGFTPSPAIARRVVSLLAEQGLMLKRKAKFKHKRQAIPRFRDMSDTERDRLISHDPRYGHVVCRCETVTEGEIVEAIRRGATTLQGIQFRTRAAMGRCQGGFCGPRLVGILARQLGISPTAVTKKSMKSRILLLGSKDELMRGEQ